MKKLIIMLVVALTVLGGATAFAASGSALIPHWSVVGSTYNDNRTYFGITNITDTEVAVTLYLYNSTNNNGVPSVFVDSPSSVSSGVVRGDANTLNYVEGNNSTAAFTIPPFSSATISIISSGATITYNGWGRIEWAQQSHNTTALLMFGSHYAKYTPPGGTPIALSEFSITINGGKAF